MQNKKLIQSEADKFKSPYGNNNLSGVIGVDAYSESALRIEYDGSSNPIYIGIAEPGTAPGSNGWQIRKLTFDGSGNMTAMQYAGGSSEFIFIWDNRASLSYS